MDVSPEAPFGYILFEYTDNDLIGQSAPSTNEYLYFCTRDQVGKVPSCTEDRIGQIIYDQQKAQSPVIARWLDGVSTGGNSSGATDPFKANVTYTVTKTGYYCARIINPNSGTINILATYHNDYGLLPPEYYPLMPMSIVVGLLYLGYLIAWSILLSLHWKEVVQLQKHVAAVLGLFFLEAISNYWFYSNYNSTGSPSKQLLILVAFIGAIRATGSLFLLLITSMGYGVVIPQLGEKASRIYTLSALHLAFSIMNIVIAATMRSKTSPLSVFLATIPVSITFIVFISWILSALTATKTTLLQRKQTAKLQMYESLSRVLVGFVAIASIIMLIAIVIVFGRTPNQAWYAAHWNHLWMVTDGWHQIMSVVAIGILAYLFRPRQYNRSFGLQELSAQPLDEEEPPFPATKVKDEDDPMGYHSIPTQLVDKEEKVPQWASQSLGVFGHDEEDAN